MQDLSEKSKKIKEENDSVGEIVQHSSESVLVIVRIIEILKIPRLPASEFLNAAIRINYHRYYVTQ